MTQIKIDHWEKAFGNQVILADASLHIPSGRRVGIVGPNGSGKTTFLHMVAGEITADRGQIKISGESSIGLLEQNPRPVKNNAPDFFAYLKRLGGEYRQDWENLSGGERTKLALAAILADGPALLLLDEPTNHLDYLGSQSLIRILADYEGTLLFVSHDRYFLDQTADEIIEIEAGEITVYAGNYRAYRTEKERIFEERRSRFEAEKKRQELLKSAIRQKKNWSKKAHRDSTKPDKSGNKEGVKEYRRAKAKKTDNQIKSAIKKLEKKMEEGEKKPREEKSVYFALDGAANRGRTLIQADGIAKSFGANRLFGPSDFYILQGEKVAFFGPNGCGKTTLFQMILGEEAFCAGKLWRSPAVRSFSLSQQGDELPKDQTLERYLLQRRGVLSGADRTDLHNFGITAVHLKEKISALSMGEMVRVRLIEAILDQRDLLFLDEPTNHLDLPAREQMEKTLAAYRGTLLIASHDVYFLEKICDKVLFFEGGVLRRLESPFAQFWQAQREVL